MQLVFKVGRPCIGADLECIIIDIETQTDPATGGNLVEFLLPELTDTACHQRQRTGPCQCFFLRGKAAITIAETNIDHDLVAFGVVGEQQHPDAIGQFQLFHFKAFNFPG